LDASVPPVRRTPDKKRENVRNLGRARLYDVREKEIGERRDRAETVGRGKFYVLQILIFPYCLRLRDETRLHVVPLTPLFSFASHCVIKSFVEPSASAAVSLSYVFLCVFESEDAPLGFCPLLWLSVWGVVGVTCSVSCWL